MNGRLLTVLLIIQLLRFTVANRTQLLNSRKLQFKNRNSSNVNRTKLDLDLNLNKFLNLNNFDTNARIKPNLENFNKNVNYNEQQINLNQSDLNLFSDLFDAQYDSDSIDLFNQTNRTQFSRQIEPTNSQQNETVSNSDYLTYLLTPDQLIIDLMFDEDSKNNSLNDEMLNEKLINSQLDLIDEPNSNKSNDNNTDEHTVQQFASLLHHTNHHEFDIDYLLLDESPVSSKLDNKSVTNENEIAQQANFSTTTNESNKPEKVYWGILLIVLPLTAIFGNCLVILAVFREKSLQSVG